MLKTPPAGRRSVRFADFEVDFQAGELHKHNRKIRVQDQPFQILTMLLERSGDVVTREELREKLWPSDTFVDFDHGLNNAVNRLREALSDSAESPRYIETLPRRGYRFIFPIETNAASVSPSPISQAFTAVAVHLRASSGDARPNQVTTLPAQRARLTRLWFVVGILVAVAVLLFGVSVWRFRDRLSGRLTTPQIRSIAVLPLENLSGDPAQEYFADGMTDALTTDLTRRSSLRVISRTSAMQYKGARKPLPQIAHELNVDAVVEGSVFRSGNRVRISAQLIHAATDRHLWAQTYDSDLSDVLTMQGQISRAIADQVETKLSRPTAALLKNVPQVNPMAYEAYLRGRFYWNKRTPEGVKQALAYFQQAVQTDPGSALGYAGVADCYTVGGGEYLGLSEAQAYPRAEAAAAKALELDDTLAEVHATLAALKTEHDWDWSGAEREFMRALELNPGYATAHQWYSQFLSAMGRHDQAIAEGHRAVELDPLSLSANWSLGARFYFARKYDEAVEQLQHTAEIDPTFAEPHSWLAFVFDKKDMHDRAFVEGQKSLTLSGVAPEVVAALAHAYTTSGWSGYWRARVKTYKHGTAESALDPTELAEDYSIAGDKDQALAWLERDYQEHLAELVYVKEKPIFDPLRSDPRFQDLLRRMAFPPQDAPVATPSLVPNASR